MGKYALSKWGHISSRGKGVQGDIVTDADFYIEKQLRLKLPKIYEVPIVGEEEGGDQTKNVFWILDPIDGTKHFAHSMPSFFTQVALIENSKPVLGVVYDPLTNQMFSATNNGGAFLNSQKIKLQKSVPMEKTIIDIDFGGPEDAEWKNSVFAELTKRVYRVRISAGRFSPYLLTGGINAYVVINPTTKIWDQLPKLIIFKEAGYEIIEFEKNGITNRVIAEKKLAKEVFDLIHY